MQSALRSSASVEKLVALVGDQNRRLHSLAPGEALFDLFRQIVHVDDCGLDARPGKPVEHVVDERAPGERHERLRHAQGQWAHALTIAAGKHHRRLSMRHGCGLHRMSGESLYKGGSSSEYQ